MSLYDISFKILRPTTKWINATFTHTIRDRSPGVIVHNHCLYDYCIVTEEKQVPLSLETPKVQCALKSFWYSLWNMSDSFQSCWVQQGAENVQNLG